MSIYSAVFGRFLLPVYEQGLRRRNTLRYLRLLEEQQWLSLAEIREIQWRKLMALLRHAEKRVPFYRNRFRAAGLSARSIDSPDQFRRLPPLTKEDIRRNQTALVAEGVSPESLHASATAGSTGEPIHFGYDHDSYEWRVAAAARADRWAGWDWGCRQFYIWGASPVPASWLKGMKKALHSRLQNMTFVNSYDFTDDVLRDYVRRLNRCRPRVVVGYTNALYEFARFCDQHSLAVWQPEGVIPTAESLYPSQRELVGKVFRAGVFDRYGCREMMNVAAECDRHMGLHLNADNLYVELQNDGVPLGAGELGEVIATDLNNYSMPFIRYQNGDLAVAAREPCSCGRGLPLLERVEGRVLDVIVTPDGRYVPGEFFFHLLQFSSGIKRFQVSQDEAYAVTVRIVPDRDFDRSALDEIHRLVRERLGHEAEVSLELVDDIPRTKGGKLRVTTSEVNR